MERQELYEKALKEQEERIQKMKRMNQELAKAHSETVAVRRYWGEVMDDLDKDHQAEVSRLLRKIKRLEKENLEPARQRETDFDGLRTRILQAQTTVILQPELDFPKSLKPKTYRRFKSP